LHDGAWARDPPGHEGDSIDFGFPTFSKTNYYDWAVLIRMMLQARDPN